MSSDRRDRFLKLERPRPDAGPADPLPDEERFDGLGDPQPSGTPAPPPAASQAPGPPPGSTGPRSATDRFRPPPPRPLDTAPAVDGEQPFVRCFECEADNSRYAASCTNCGARLDTEAQRAFNEKLWRTRKAEAEAERKATAELEAARQAQAAEQARVRREVAEEMARREKDRIDAELPDGPFGGDPVGGRRGGDTAGMRLLRLIPGTGWRIAAAVAMFTVPFLLAIFGPGQLRAAGMLLLFVVIGLFSPGRRRQRRW